MIVYERVIDVLAVAPLFDDALGAQDTQLLRERGQLLSARLCKLGDAAFSVAELLDQAQPMDVAGGAEQGRRTGADVICYELRHQVVISTNDEVKGFLLCKSARRAGN